MWVSPSRSLFTFALLAEWCTAVSFRLNRTATQFLSLWTERHAPAHSRQGGFNTNNRMNIEVSRIYFKRDVHFRSSLVDLWLTSYQWQISKEALEHSKTKWLQYQLRMAFQYSADQLVFIDESACDRYTYLQDKAWALEGHQAVCKQVFLRSK